MILKIVPKFILALFFPTKFRTKLPRFIQTFDKSSGKNIYLYMREDSFMEKVIYNTGLYGEWEKKSLEIWAVLSKKSKTIIDIGANTGIYSLIAQNNNLKAKVIAIEPIDINFNILNRNISKNKFNILSEKIALSDTNGTANMFMLKNKLNYMTSINDNRYDLHPEIQGDNEVVKVKIPTQPFSYLTKKHSLDKIDLIKIDVEGHELTVLKSMFEIIKKDLPNILIEIIDDSLAEEVNAFFDQIEDYNYVSIDEVNTSKIVSKLWNNDHHNFLICNTNSLEHLKVNGLIQ